MANDTEQKIETLEVVAPHVVELVERAQIDMQIATARKYPRNLAAVKSKMLSFATLDEETAQACFYTVPRDGKNIQGPSVRLAEIAVSCYGNLRAASRIIDNDGKVITAQGICHDLENNTMISVEVKRRITNKHGKTYSDDMQVTTGNAACAIAFRNSVFKIVPGALVKPVYDAAKDVAVGNASTLVEKRDKILKRLNSMGVQNDLILLRLQVERVENIDLDGLGVLIGLGTAIKDGDTTVDEAFPKPTQERATIPIDSLKPSDNPNRPHADSMTTDAPASGGLKKVTEEDIAEAKRALEAKKAAAAETAPAPEMTEAEMAAEVARQDAAKEKKATAKPRSWS